MTTYTLLLDNTIIYTTSNSDAMEKMFTTRLITIINNNTDHILSYSIDYDNKIIKVYGRYINSIMSYDKILNVLEMKITDQSM